MTDHGDQGEPSASPPGRPPPPDLSGAIAAARADEPWAYRRLFEWLGGPVAGYLRSQGAEDPDDLANDVFLRAFTNLDTFEGDEARFRSWLFTIAHNRLIDDRRRRSRRPVVVDRADAVDAGQEPGADDRVLERMADERVLALLDGLSAGQRDVLLLRIVADLTVEQVSDVVGKRPGAVKQLQRRGLATLRRRLEQEGA